VFSIVEEKDPARAPLHQERNQRRISLGSITVLTGEDQVIRPVVSRLAPAGPHMVQGYSVAAGFGAAVCTNRPVKAKQPITM
jgi:hypothetical protein